MYGDEGRVDERIKENSHDKLKLVYSMELLLYSHFLPSLSSSVPNIP
jgi:hypothetical protein